MSNPFIPDVSNPGPGGQCPACFKALAAPIHSNKKVLDVFVDKMYRIYYSIYTDFFNLF